MKPKTWSSSIAFNLKTSFAIAIAAASLVDSPSLQAADWQPAATPLAECRSIACAQSGQALYTVLGDGAGYFYASTNIGGDWTNTLRQIAGPVTCSGDGCKVAVADDGAVMISTNMGMSFATNNGAAATAALWSQSGDMLVVAAGGISITTNDGATWFKPPAMQSNDWEFLAISADGRTIVAAGQAYALGRLRVSNNSGVSWADAPVTNRYWGPVACTADGSKIFAAATDVNTGLLVSRDHGRTWSYPSVPGLIVPPQGEPVGFLSLACSEDGSLLLAKIQVYGQPRVFVSRNSGSSWFADDTPTAPVTLTCSSDGTLLMASVGGIILQYLAPPLHIAASGSQLTLSWPAPSGQYVLQQTSDLAATNWLPITNALTVTNYRNQVVLPAPASGNVFYRLYGPGS